MPVFAGDIVNGKYRVEHVLGEGGMGVVVAARHLELEELYAIKVMKREALGCDAYAERRFIGEARAAARLKGEHVARVHDIGRLDTGELYMVMEHLVGTDLKTVVHKRGPLPVEEAISYVLQTCEAIAEAHALDIIHRDIKPHNLFLTEGGKSIKVLDFGISKQPPKQGPDLTGTNIILGTLLYMSPEQMQQSKTVDARSDVWSIGVVLYELVTGSVPFPGEGILEIAIRVSNGTLTPPSQLRPGLPAAIDAIVERCLQKAPAQRFASVTELARALCLVMAPSTAWVAPPIVLQPVPPVVVSPVDPGPSGSSVSQATIKRERNVAATPPRPLAPAQAAGHSSPDITASGESSYPEMLPHPNTRRVWSWAIRLGIMGIAVLMTAIFNGWLRSPASTLQSDVNVHGASPSAHIQLPGKAPHETSPDAPVQSSSGLSHEASPSTPVQPASERPAQVIQITDVHSPSQTTGASSPGAPAHFPSEQSYQASTSAPVQRPSHRSHETNSSSKARYSSQSSNEGESGANTPPASNGGMSVTTFNASLPGKASTIGQTILSPSGAEDRALGAETNSRCKALTDGHFPYLVDLSRYTSERRSQLTKISTCDGDKAKTQLCCRVPIIE